MKVYYLRFLPPRATGNGILLHALAASDGYTLAKWKEAHPEQFKRPGTYTLMTWTDDQLHVG